MLLTILLTCAGILVGVLAGYLARAFLAKRNISSAEARAQRILDDAKSKEALALEQAKAHEQRLLLEAKERALEIVAEAQKELQEKIKSLDLAQERLSERERRFDETLIDVEKRKESLEQAKLAVVTAQQAVELTRIEAEQRLAEIAGLNKEQALSMLLGKIERDHQDALLERVRKMDLITEEEIENKARKVLSLAIQRFASSHVADATITYVELPSEDMKGRIIGKEGRNIKAIEHQTGCELIIDDTPGVISISGFSPVRRQVAKRALELLMKDGRIQPARIEEAIKEAKNDLAKEMKKTGEDALYELGIPVPSIDPKLIAILGRLKFRTSYGQNVLQHSLEVARIAGMIGEELGLDPFPLKKGGLFHDIGKAVDHDMQGAHPQIGYNIMKKFGFPEDLCYQSIAHHEDRPRTLEGVIVKAADAISGARPGARRNSVEEYIQRLQNLEAVASGFEGVEKAYAIQAGREVRVFVEPGMVDDYKAYEMAKNIAHKIEKELTYPGEVKITVIREKRVIEFAR
ncbi:ribonuclease Y [bacterium]|nr:ribonuclease Y [bacterium]